MSKLQGILVGCLMWALLAATAEGQRRPRKPQPPISRWGKVLIAEGTQLNNVQGGEGLAIGALKPDGLNRLYVPSFNGAITEFEYNQMIGQWTSSQVVTGNYECLAIGNGRDDPSGTQRIFATEVANRTIWEISFEGGSWVKRQVASLSKRPLMPVIGNGRNDTPFKNRLYVPAYDGTHEFTYVSGAWQQTSFISQFTGVAIGPVRDNVYRLYGSDGDIVESRHMYEYTWNGSSWTSADMGPWVSQDALGVEGREYRASVAVGRNDGTLRVYTQTTDVRFYEYSYQPGVGWTTLVLNPTEPIPQFYGRQHFGHILGNPQINGYCAGTMESADSVGVYEFSYDLGIGSWIKNKIGTAGLGGASLVIGDARNDGGVRIYTCSQAGVWFGVPKVVSTAAVYEFYIAW